MDLMALQGRLTTVAMKFLGFLTDPLKDWGGSGDRRSLMGNRPLGLLSIGSGGEPPWNNDSSYGRLLILHGWQVDDPFLLEDH
jgi:hypothetical protein